MTGNGRPLRFLALVMTGWIGARAMMLWPVDAAIATGRAVTPSVAGEPSAIDRAIATAAPPGARVAIAGPPRRAGRTRPVAAFMLAPPPVPPVFVDRVVEPYAGIVAGLPVVPRSPAKPRSRWFGSAWAVARDGGGPAGGVPGVQLGGSQAGLRLGYALTADRRFALVARVSSPLGRGMREAALGVEWQPTRLPVRIVAEQRVALNVGKGGPTLAVVGGVGPAPLAAGFRLEAYAQGGVIGRDGAEGFADGALRIARAVATSGRVRVDLGAGSWGAIQQGARRIDVGPSLSATVPVGPQPVRLSLDWRQRVAGNAAPGSGLVVTLGTDF